MSQVKKGFGHIYRSDSSKLFFHTIIGHIFHLLLIRKITHVGNVSIVMLMKVVKQSKPISRQRNVTYDWNPTAMPNILGES
jgi:hypothetical protein